MVVSPRSALILSITNDAHVYKKYEHMDVQITTQAVPVIDST